MSRVRTLLATLFAMSLVMGASTGTAKVANAASCVRIVGGTWNPPGNDNYSPALNAESVKIKNTCATAQVMTGWRLHDYKAQHTFRFLSGFKIGPGITVTVYSGRGTRTSTKLYFGFTYGAVWNDTPPERAYLRNAAGTVVSTWSAY
jgi:Lamin Tail Domain